MSFDLLAGAVVDHGHPEAWSSPLSFQLGKMGDGVRSLGGCRYLKFRTWLHALDDPVLEETR